MSDGGNQESVVIVGAGIIGIGCAQYLAKAGFKVTVIDKGSIAAACSAYNCGYICPSHVPPLTEPGAIGTAIKSMFNPQSPFRVKPRFDPSLWLWMLQFAKRCNHGQVLSAGKHLQAILDASMDEYKKLIPELQLDCEWEEKGLLYVLQTDKGMESFAKMDKMLTEEFGVSANRIEGAKLPDFDPGFKPGLAGAFHYPDDTSVRPESLNQSWAKSLQSQGIEFVENCELQAVRKSAGRITSISTSQREFEADHFVFAMGAWSQRWSQELECKIPIQPGKGYSMTMERPENSPTHPVLFPEHKVGVSPFENGFRLGSMMEFAGFDTTIPAARIQQLRDSARPYLVASVDGDAKITWYGWRPMTWDSLPVIGPTPNFQNGYLATGHNMLGLSLAPATGRLVTEMITGESPYIAAEPYSPTRF